MQDVNTISDTLVKVLVWALPGLLLVVGTILVLSWTDRYRRNQQPREDEQ